MGPLQPQLVLASASPRRAALLEGLGFRLRAEPADVDETRRPGELPTSLVQRLALAKARAVADRLRAAGDRDAGLPVLGSDTVVALDNTVFGKPVDRADALAMLGRLSGRTHEVLTAVAIIAGGAVHLALSRSCVTFRDISTEEAQRYWATGEPRDKAGGYGIQGIGGIFALRLEGSHTGVMGLPVAETEALLRAAGVDSWLHRPGQDAGALETARPEAR